MPGGRTTSRAMSYTLLSSYSSCFVFTKHPIQLKTITTCFQNMFFSKKAPKQKGGCLDTLDPPGSATDETVRWCLSDCLSHHVNHMNRSSSIRRVWCWVPCGQEISVNVNVNLLSAQMCCWIQRLWSYDLMALYKSVLLLLLLIVFALFSRHIYRTEGVRALFKGLGPTLLGIAPSR